MNKSLKRFVSASMAVLITISTATTNVFAATPSQGGVSGAPTVSPGNFPGNGTNPTPRGDHGGVRVTVTNMTQAGASNITPIELGDSYTAAINQFNDLASILTKKVWQPGNYGLKVIKLGKVNSLS